MALGTEIGLGPATLCYMETQLTLKGARPQVSANVYCGQTAGWMKVTLGTEIDLSPGHIVLDGDPAPPERGTAAGRAPFFRPMSIVATVAHLSY